MFWYYDYVYGEMVKMLFVGFVGIYIVDDFDDDEFELLWGKYDVLLMIQDCVFNVDGTFCYCFDIDFGYCGDTIVVNGVVMFWLRVERWLYWLRLINVFNACSYVFVFGNGCLMFQIGFDGGLFLKFVLRTLILLALVECVDVLVDFCKFGVGLEVILHNIMGEVMILVVMRFDVVRGGKETVRVLKVMCELELLLFVNV